MIYLALKLGSDADWWSQEAVVLKAENKQPAAVPLDPEYEAAINLPVTSLSPFLQWAIAELALSEPPADNSLETKDELRGLQAWVEFRTPEQISEIKSEMIVTGFNLGPWKLSALTRAKPQTGILLDYANETMKPVVYHFKQKFNRTRPNVVDPTLTTVIDVPGHPAYPSGHASQAYLFAHILTYLDPINADSYFDDAARIARNREIAGLHYPSDSEAGRVLAGQFFLMLLSDETFKSLLKAAEREW